MLANCWDRRGERERERDKMQAYSSEDQDHGETVESMETEQAENVSEKASDKSPSSSSIGNGGSQETAAAPAAAKKKQVSGVPHIL